MRRNRLRYTLCLLPLLFLISCNGKFGAIIPDYSIYDGKNPEASQIVLSHDYSGEAYWGFKSLIDEFNHENEWDIKVVISADPDAAADLRILKASEATALLRRGESIELSPLIYHPIWGGKKLRSDFYPAARKQTDYWDFSRKITSIPLSIDADILLVNNEILHEAGFDDFPSSWPVMNYLFRKLSSKYGMPGIGIDCDAGSIISIINARGGSILRPNGFSYSLNNPVVNRAIRYLRRQTESSVISRNTSDYLNQTNFAFGGMLSVFTGVDGIKYYNNLISAVNPGLDWSAALLPTRRLGDGLTVNCRSAVITSKDEASQIAAWNLIMWLSTVPSQQSLAQYTGSFPVNLMATEKILDDSEGKASDLQSRQWIEALRLFHNSHMEVLPNFSDYLQVASGFEELVEGALAGDIIWLETWRLNRRVKQSRRTEE